MGIRPFGAARKAGVFHLRASGPWRSATSPALEDGGFPADLLPFENAQLGELLLPLVASYIPTPSPVAAAMPRIDQSTAVIVNPFL